jgi:hypothetical protein
VAIRSWFTATTWCCTGEVEECDVDSRWTAADKHRADAA